VRRVTPGQGDLKESGTEKIPPWARPSAAVATRPLRPSRRVRVKRCG